MKTYLHLWQYLAKFFLEWEMFYTESCRENQKKDFMFNNSFPKILLIMR